MLRGDCLIVSFDLESHVRLQMICSQLLVGASDDMFRSELEDQCRLHM